MVRALSTRNRRFTGAILGAAAVLWLSGCTGELEDKLAVAQSELAKLKSELGNAQSELATARDELSTAKDEVKQKTEELAVMVDTFNPLHIAIDALEMEKPEYQDSWIDPAWE